jgi:hypothetical protein
LAAFGSALVGSQLWLALLLFIAAAGCVVWARRGLAPVFSGLAPEPQPRRSWEPWFLLALLGLGLLSFGWRLGSIPEGANYSEGYLAVSAGGVSATGHYVAHDERAETNWPTLYHYQGLTAVKLLGNHQAS